MQAFTANLEKRIASHFGNDLHQLPPSITLLPRKWSAADMGGPKAATIEAAGSPEDLAFLLTWLGDLAFIHNEMGTAVWWGVVYEIEANFGGTTVSLSIESVYNRIAVLYPFTLPDGSTESRRTDWAGDGTSISRYGERQMLYSLPDALNENADAVRDRLLTQFADPAPVISTNGQNSYGARLFCRGHWAFLDACYWTNSKGLESYEEFGGGQQFIGASLTATTISFGESAAPIGEDGADFIKDSGNRFGPLVEGTVIKVSGAAESANNDITTVQRQEGVDMIATIENTQVDEAAGATVTIALGEFGMVGWAAQSFTVPEAWTATKVALRIKRVGSPVDTVIFDINANGAGIPGTTLATATIVGSTLPTEYQWVEAALDVSVDLAIGTTYWVEVGRTGAASLDKYYMVALDEGLGHSGVLKVYNGSISISGSWVDRDPDADMPFRIIGERDSLVQARAAMDASPEFVNIYPQSPASGVLTKQYRESDVNILDEAMEMFDLGTSAGERVIAHVDPDRKIIIESVAPSSNANPMLGMDGRLRHASGALWEPGGLIAGRWVDIEAMPVLDGLTRATGQRAVYVKECEYDAQNDRLMIQSEGALDPWQAIRWERR